MRPAGNQIVPRAFGRAFDQDGRFDLQETVTIQVVPNVLYRLMTQAQVVLHPGPPQVEITIPQAQALVGVNVVRDVEGRGERLVQHRQPFHHDLDLAGGQRRIFGTLRAEPNCASDFNAPFGAEAFGGLVVLRGQMLRIQHYLHVPGAVSQINEYDPAVVPPPAYPAGQRRGGAIVGGAQFAAVLGFQGVNSWEDW